MFEFIVTDFLLTFAALILFAVLVFCAETERLFTGLIVFVAFLVGADWLFDLPVWAWVVNNPFFLIGYTVIFLAIGAAYATLWKWRKYCAAHGAENAKRLTEYLGKHDGATREGFYHSSYENKLHPSNHFDKWANWMLFWPFSIFWALLHDPITWLATTIYDLLGGALTKIMVAATEGAVKPSTASQDKPSNR